MAIGRRSTPSQAGKPVPSGRRRSSATSRASSTLRTRNLPRRRKSLPRRVRRRFGYAPWMRRSCGTAPNRSHGMMDVGGRRIPAPMAPRSYGGGGLDWLDVFTIPGGGTGQSQSYDWGGSRASARSLSTWSVGRSSSSRRTTTRSSWSSSRSSRSSSGSRSRSGNTRSRNR